MFFRNEISDAAVAPFVVVVKNVNVWGNFIQLAAGGIFSHLLLMFISMFICTMHFASI